jgi:hypothetical protein
MNEHRSLSQGASHRLRPPQHDAAEKEKDTVHRLKPEQRFLAAVETSGLGKRRVIVRGIAMSHPQPSPVVAVEPHLAFPGNEHCREDKDEEQTAERMPRADGSAAAEDEGQPVEARRPQRKARQCGVEEAQRDEPMNQPLGQGEAR